jgi:hypothetical protein
MCLRSVFAIGLLLLNGACTRDKDRLDEEARGLCAKEGGVRVFETVMLPPGMFSKYGDAIPPGASKSAPFGSHYDRIHEEKYLREGNPSLRRSHWKIIRKADQKVLGESVSYHRVGGDLPGPWHESSFSCPEVSGNVVLARRVFVQGDK